MQKHVSAKWSVGRNPDRNVSSRKKKRIQHFWERWKTATQTVIFYPKKEPQLDLNLKSQSSDEFYWCIWWFLCMHDNKTSSVLDNKNHNEMLWTVPVSNPFTFLTLYRLVDQQNSCWSSNASICHLHFSTRINKWPPKADVLSLHFSQTSSGSHTLNIRVITFKTDALFGMCTVNLN